MRILAGAVLAVCRFTEGGDARVQRIAVTGQVILLAYAAPCGAPKLCHGLDLQRRGPPLSAYGSPRSAMGFISSS